ncbi:hypothetical protein [Pedobacter nyackensis]|uniref:hypothetical protein n=1 Tax=Pedobacter nyackensis TaxID=475255 RepID=UPI00292DBDF1|nr:hypothetical protein [Pedobacter nyackensis]
MMLRYLIFFICFLFSAVVNAQRTIDCEKELDKEPYFVKHKTSEKDSLLKRDIAILKHCGNFESIDSVFFKGQMLGSLMLDQVRLGKPATYRTLIEYFAEFKKTIGYKDFIKGLVLYKEMAMKKVNLDNWETDKELFVRMGFTVGDLDDFKGFLTSVASENLTYKVALTRYMSEIEAMRIDK